MILYWYCKEKFCLGHSWESRVKSEMFEPYHQHILSQGKQCKMTVLLGWSMGWVWDSPLVFKLHLLWTGYGNDLHLSFNKSFSLIQIQFHHLFEQTCIYLVILLIVKLSCCLKLLGQLGKALYWQWKRERDLLRSGLK